LLRVLLPMALVALACYPFLLPLFVAFTCCSFLLLLIVAVACWFFLLLVLVVLAGCCCLLSLLLLFVAINSTLYMYRTGLIDIRVSYFRSPSIANYKM